MKHEQAPAQQHEREQTPQEPATAAAQGAGVSALRSMNYEAGAAAVSPFRGGDSPVQLKPKPGVQLRGAGGDQAGVGKEGDQYEQHADRVADLVVSGQSAEGALGEMTGGAVGADGAAAEGGDGPVQMKLIPGQPVSELDAETVKQMIAQLRPTASYKAIIRLWQDLSKGGTQPLSVGAKEDVTLEALIAIESAFKFSGDVSIDTLWDDSRLMGIILGAIEHDAKPAEEEPIEQPPEDKPEPVVLPRAGTYGMTTEDTKLMLEDGSTLDIRAGESIEALRGGDGSGQGAGQLVVKAHTGQPGKIGSIDPKLFKPQPKLTVDEDTGKTDDYSYESYVGDLFLARNGVKAPSVMDVDQGSIGDCYLIAAMGAVAASNPGVIEDMISYDDATGLFTVTFQEMQRDRSFKAHVEVVDTFMPTRAGGGANRTAFAMSDKAFDPNTQAMWPMIIEKAYAQWQGGYHVLDEGGSSSKTMQLFTGVRSVRDSMPAEDDVIARFEQFQAENKAVVCGSRDEIQQSDKTGVLDGAGDGPYTGQLQDRDGAGAEIVKGTVRIRDTEGSSGTARDDREGALTGTNVDNGTVNYERGNTELNYNSGKGPESKDDLSVSYEYEGMLSSSLNIHGNHAYIFREVKDGMLQFHNPWGPAAHKHPKPVSPAAFRDYFESIGVNATVPQQDR
jgi:hypothetical protein